MLIERKGCQLTTKGLVQQAHAPRPRWPVRGCKAFWYLSRKAGEFNRWPKNFDIIIPYIVSFYCG